MKVLICLGLVLVSLQIVHAEVSSQGEVSLQYRQFKKDNKDSTEDLNLSIFSRVQLDYNQGAFGSKLSAIGRSDHKERDRSVVLLEDAYVHYYMGAEEEWKILLGYKKFNWSATEAFHPADIINSRNYDSDLENLEKRGELTFEIERSLGEGKINLFLFPRFERPLLPSSSSRLGPGITTREAMVVGEDGQTSKDFWQTQYGLQVSQTFGRADITLHAIKHVDRYFPKFGYLSSVDAMTNSSTPVPYYFWVTQYGGTYQHALGGFLLKTEFAHREFGDGSVLTLTSSTDRPLDHSELAVGGEYLFELDSGHELTLIVEGQATLGTNKKERVALNYFQRDMLFGARYVFNDIMGKELFLSVIKDVELSSEQIYNLNYSQRLNNNWKMKTGLRLIDANQKGSTPQGLEYLDEDGHFHFSLTRYF